MKVLNASDLPLETPVAMALGFFDGVHKGHQVLLTALREQPEKSLVFTFDRKPDVPKPLFTAAERAAIVACDGIDYYYEAPFDANMQDMSPRAFVRQITKQFNIKAIVVGADFHFGSDAAGDAELLKEMADKYCYKLIVVPVRGEGDDKYSSTDVRYEVQKGHIEEANELMGRLYFIDAKVEHGSRLGEKLGFPTANMFSNKVLPARGVYATLTKTNDGIFNSVTNVGIRPTIDDGDVENIETHLLDHRENLYGQDIRVYFIKRLRGEQHFANVEELKNQIASDAREAAHVLADPAIYKKYRMC